MPRKSAVLQRASVPGYCRPRNQSLRDRLFRGCRSGFVRNLLRVFTRRRSTSSQAFYSQVCWRDAPRYPPAGPPASSLPTQLPKCRHSCRSSLPKWRAWPTCLRRRSQPPLPSLPTYPPQPTDMVGAGGGDLKTGQIAASTGVQAQRLPPHPGQRQRRHHHSYAGRLHVVGQTIGEVESKIQASLRGLSQNPQVIVTQAQIITNSVIVSGEVARPGRLVLQTNRETLTDAIAVASGYRGTARDVVLRVNRRGENVDIYLNDHPELDVRTYPGDRLM